MNESPAAPQQPERPSPSRLGRGVAVGLLLAVVVYGSFAFVADFDALRSASAELRWEIIAAACALSCGNFVLRFVRWQRYLRVLGVRIGLGPSAGVFGAGFVLTLSPGKLAELYKVSLLRRYAEEPPEVSTGVAVVIAERLTDLIGMVLLLSGGLFAFPAAWPIAVAASAASVVGVLALSSSRLRQWVVARLRGGRTDRLATLLEGMFAELGVLLRTRWLVVGTVLAALAWGLQAGALCVLASAIGGDGMSLTESAFTYAAATLGGVATFLPGGLGATELGLTALVERFAGVTTQVAGFLAVLARAATLWLAVVLGGVAWIVLRWRAPRNDD